MELTLIRTRFSRGFYSELYHKRKLVFCALEIIPKNQVTLFSALEDGRYTLNKPAMPGVEWQLELRAAGGRGPLKMYLPAEKPMGLPGCVHPVMLHTGYGETLVSELVYKNVERIIMPALLQKKTIGISVETAGR